MFGLFGGRTQSMNMHEAKAELEKDKGIVLLDVRNPDEYKQGHIKNSINIPLHLLPAVLADKVPQKDKRIFAYCLSGSRSSQAVSWMKSSGYTNVTNIGGISSWDGPVVRG